jgi:hypothetical protein
VQRERLAKLKKKKTLAREGWGLKMLDGVTVND